MIVTTGFGYYLKDGEVKHKYILPLGEHPLSEGYTQVEVNSKEDLDAIVCAPQTF